MPSPLCCFLTAWSVSLSAKVRYILLHRCILRITWQCLGRASQCLWCLLEAHFAPKSAQALCSYEPLSPYHHFMRPVTVITPSSLTRHNKATFLWRILTSLTNNENLINTIFITVFAKSLKSEQSLMALKPLPGHLSFVTVVCLGERQFVFFCFFVLNNMAENTTHPKLILWLQQCYRLKLKPHVPPGQ